MSPQPSSHRIQRTLVLTLAAFAANVITMMLTGHPWGAARQDRRRPRK